MPQDHPLPYIQQYQQQLSELRHQMRRDIEQIQEPQGVAMMKTAAEVLQGLSQAFDDYQLQEEPAGKPGPPQVETRKPQDTGKKDLAVRLALLMANEPSGNGLTDCAG